MSRRVSQKSVEPSTRRSMLGPILEVFTGVMYLALVFTTAYAAIACGFGVFNAARSLTYTETTTGEVVEHWYRSRACGAWVRYQVDGEFYEAKSSACIVDLGDSKQVRYDPDDPSRAVANPVWHSLAMIVFFGFLGTLVSIASLAFTLAGLSVIARSLPLAEKPPPSGEDEETEQRTT